MSFILDALRKSEHERQRQGGPGIADLKPVALAARLPLWAIALGALLLINIAVVLVLMLREPQPRVADDVRTAGSPPGAAATTPAAQVPGASPAPPAGAPPATQYALPPPVLAPGRPEIRPPADTEYSADGAQDVMAEPQLDRSMSSVTPPERSANEENLPTLNDVLMQGAGRVPELHLDIHVYTPRPADRFVFINNRKYREGGETPDGTRIERITPDGVVLNHRGLRFLMPRQ